MRKHALYVVALALVVSSNASGQEARVGSEAAARIGDRTVTTNELDERWRAIEPADHADLMQKLYTQRKMALEAIIADLVLGQAAMERGLSREAFEEAELAKRLKPIADTDVAVFYAANIGQMQGRPLDAMAPAIKNYLDGQQRTRARQELVRELRKSGPAVRVLFDIPRQSVAVAQNDPWKGAEHAPVTIVEFADFQCPYCRHLAPTLRQVLQTYGDKVRVVWKDFPLTRIHPEALLAGEAAHCAGDQGKYWEFHDRLFANQEALELENLSKYAAELGLDRAAFDDCLDTSKYGDRVRQGVEQGSRLGVNSTPTLFINGRLLTGAQPYDAVAALIEEELSLLSSH